ncbi:hypothetical protein APHAL10511_007600 [Amanita phalloides]|nr:hypothetical protein APHAL10511_007600 [Amanita phalloides]
MYDQAVHDEINLARLLRRLEKSTAPHEWKDADKKQDTWLKAEAVLQRVKFARKLLRNCESSEDVDENKSHLFRHWKGKLDTVETTVGNIRDRVRPTLTPAPPILSSLPVPIAVPEAAKPANDDPSAGVRPPEHLAKKAPPETLALPAEQLLLSPSDTTPLPSANLPSARLIPSHFSSARPLETTTTATGAAATTGASRFLHSSNALHQDLSEQLAQMAVQLKRNTLHFSEMLEKDKAIVEDTQQKLEGNFDVMQSERIRLRDHRGKSGSTTCLVVAIVLVVVLLFAMMVFLIRLTRTI